MERAAKWSRRHRSLVAGLIAVLLIAVVALSASTALIAAAYEREAQAADGEREARYQAQQKADVAERARDEEATARQRAERSEARAYQQQYYSAMRLGLVDWQSSNIARLYQTLVEHLPEQNRADHRGWEWYFLLSASQQAQTLTDHEALVSSIAWSPDGRHLATSSYDATARVWDARSGNVVRTFYHSTVLKRGVAWSPDGQRLAWGSVGDENTVRIWDRASDQVQLLNGHTHSLVSLAWGPDGRLLATSAMDGTARVWDVGTQECLHVLSGHDGHVASVCWSPDGTHLASTAWDGARIWNAATGQLVHHCAPNTKSTSVAWSRNGRQLAVGTDSGDCLLVHPETGQVVRTIPLHAGRINSQAVSPDGQIIVSGGADGRILGRSVAENKVLFALHGHRGQVMSVTWDLDGRQVASAGADGTVRIWSVPPPPQPRVLNGVEGGLRARSLAWNASSDRLSAVALRDRSSVTWNPATGEIVDSHPGAQDRAEESSPDGRLVAVMVNHGKHLTIVIRDTQADRQVATITSTLSGLGNLVWSPDGSRLAAFTEHRWEVWDVAMKGLLHASDSPWIASLAWAPDSQRLAWAGNGDLNDPGTPMYWSWVHVFDLNLMQRVLKRRVGETRVRANCVAWSPDGQRLAAGNEDGFVAVWHARTGQSLASKQLHTTTVHAIDWTPDGRRVATASQDRTVKVWDPATGEELLAFADHQQPAVAVRWSRDGQRLAAGFHDGQVHLWDASAGYEVMSSPARKRVQAQMLAGQAAQLQARGETDAPRAIFSQAVELEPTDIGLRRIRLGFYAAQNQWPEALAEASVLAELAPGDGTNLYKKAVIAAALGWEKDYRAACASLREQLDGSWDADISFWMAKCCILLPGGTDDPERVMELTRRAIQEQSYNPFHVSNLGAVLYRSGRLEEAIKTLRNVVASAGADGLPGDNGYFLAMAYHRLGQHQEARRWFEKATAHRTEALAESGKALGEVQPLLWTRRLTLQILHSEAESLLGVQQEQALPQKGTPSGDRRKE